MAFVLPIMADMDPNVRREDNNIGCFVSGECTKSVMENVYADVSTPEMCLGHCKAQEGCRYFTLHNQACFLYSNCKSLDTSIEGAVSGDSECWACSMTGTCTSGDFRLSTEATDEYTCATECGSEKKCEVYSWDKVDRVCALLETCDEYDSSAEGFVSGSKACSEEVQPTTDPAIFVAGGYGSSGMISDVEVVNLDPEDAGSCMKPADFPDGRYWAVGGVLDGAPEVCSGYNGYYLSTCYQYSKSSDQWATSTSLSDERYGAASTMMSDGRWVISGGYNSVDGYLDTTEIKSGNQVSFGSALDEETYLHCMASLNNTHAMVVGGYSPTGGYKQAYIYQPSSDGGSTSTITTLQQPTHTYTYPVCGMVQKQDGTQVVIAAGGSSSYNQVELFSLDTMEWEVGPSLPDGVYLAASVVHNNMFYMVGGYNTGDYEYSDKIMRFNIDDNAWTVMDQTLEMGRAYHVAMVVDAAEYC